MTKRIKFEVVKLLDGKVMVIENVRGTKRIESFDSYADANKYVQMCLNMDRDM